MNDLATNAMCACHQCGHEASEFSEGVCIPCCEQNQQALDIHNAEHDYWQGLTDRERGDAIRRAYV